MVYRIGAVCIGIALVVLGIQGAFHREGSLPLASQLPELGYVKIAPGLVDQSGKPFLLPRGQVWIANFVFTSCPTVCPRLTRVMGEIEGRTRDLGDRIGMVSFSVDPETDDPSRLRAFAADHKANLARWSFVTGLRPGVEKTLKESFFVGMGLPTKASGLIEIAHSEKFALVDANGQLRALQSVQSEADIKRLEKLARDLAQATFAE